MGSALDTGHKVFVFYVCLILTQDIKTGVIPKKFGPGFPGETFRVLKEKEEHKRLRGQGLTLDKTNAEYWLKREVFGVRLGILRFSVIHKKVGPFNRSLSHCVIE